MAIDLVVVTELLVLDDLVEVDREGKSESS